LASIERRIIDAILTRIRVKQVAPSNELAGRQAVDSKAIPPAEIREAKFSDFEAVTELKRKWGLVPDPIKNWERLWIHNPALAGGGPERPIGWVLEADGRVVGYHGNILLLYRYSGRALTVAAGHGFVVEPLYRALSVSLSRAFHRQQSVDICLTTTAIEPVTKVARVFKSQPIPQPDYETVLFWVLRPYPFAREVVKRLKLKPALSALGTFPASLAAGADQLLHRRWPSRSSNRFAISEIKVSEIGDEFQDLWAAKLSEGPRLLADRSPETLRWHFEIPGDRGTTRVLRCHENGELLGYAVIRSGAGQEGGLRRSVIADMLVKQDDSAVVGALLVAAYTHAKRAGSHTLEVLGFPQNIRKVCSRGNPYLRKYPSCPFFYVATDPELQKILSQPESWYATPYDGDTTLMP
jgi:hypothetical protein